MKTEQHVLTGFIRNVSRHHMSIERDDGLYRHLRFKSSGTNTYYFDLVTWPGYLTVTGDMGTWTFSRITDMFEFFSSEHFGRRESFLINPGYWAEKFEAGAGGGRFDSPCYEFDDEGFDEGLQQWLAAYLEDCDNEDDRELAIETVRELKGNRFREQNDAYYAVESATWPDNVSAWDFMDGMSLQRYSHHYLWICLAIVWGIERYRTSKLVDKAMVTFLAFKRVEGGAA
ncbi:TPA: hypothetical protein HL358_15345 [Escherichia coli]|nr:hypothetical protein [Escherichia coli]